VTVRPGRRLDGAALYAAMDAQRETRGLSWQEVARQTGVAASTLQHTRLNGPMETDGILAMARWLDRPLEDFIRGAEATAKAQREIALYRFNCKALYAALDEQRRAREMTWAALAAELGGVSSAMLTRLAKGGRVGAHVMVPAVGWLNRTVASFCCDPTVTGRAEASTPARTRPRLKMPSKQM
jgi:hypothetical protein